MHLHQRKLVLAFTSAVSRSLAGELRKRLQETGAWSIECLGFSGSVVSRLPYGSE